MSFWDQLCSPNSSCWCHSLPTSHLYTVSKDCVRKWCVMGRSPQCAQKKTLGNGASVIELPILLETSGVNVRHRLQFCLFYSRVKTAKTSRREEIKAKEDWTGVTGILRLGRNSQNQVLQTRVSTTDRDRACSLPSSHFSLFNDAVPVTRVRSSPDLFVWPCSPFALAWVSPGAGNNWHYPGTLTGQTCYFWSSGLQHRGHLGCSGLLPTG